MNELIDFSYLKFDKDSNSGSDEKYNDLYNNEWYMFKFGTPLPPKKRKTSLFRELHPKTWTA